MTDNDPYSVVLKQNLITWQDGDEEELDDSLLNSEDDKPENGEDSVMEEVKQTEVQKNFNSFNMVHC